MIKTNVSGTGMVFKKEFDNGSSAYSTTISKKNGEEWENAYIGIQFRKGAEPQHHKTRIEIHSGWLSFFKTKDDKTVFYIFAYDYSEVDDGEKKENNIPEGFSFLEDDDFPFGR